MLVAVLAVLVLCGGAVAIWAATRPAELGGKRPPASPTPNPSEARPGVDLGAGTPNAPCATNRLGYFFVKDGVTYTCKGPAPYRWRQ